MVITCEEYIKNFETSSSKKITSPTGRKILRSGSTAKKHYMKCLEEPKNDEEIKSSEELCQAFIKEYEDTSNDKRTTKITKPDNGRKILKRGAVARKVYEECKLKLGKEIEKPKNTKIRKSRNTNTNRTKFQPKSKSDTSCKEFIKRFDKLEREGKVDKIRSPISGRLISNTAASAKSIYKNCRIEENMEPIEEENSIMGVKRRGVVVNRSRKKKDISEISFKKQVHSPKRRIVSPKKRKGKFSCIENSKVKLRKHQKDTVEYLLKDEHRGIIAALDTGSGKSLLGITATVCLMDMNKDAKVLVLTPNKSLETNMRKEMESYGLDPYDPRYTIETFDKFKNREDVTCDPNTILLVDEAHNLRTNTHRNIKGRRSGVKARAVLECAKTAWKVILLTATPLYNKPYDLVNLVSMVKGIDPLTESQFDKVLEDDKLFNDYFSCMLYIYKNEKSSHFPRKVEHNINIEMSDEYYEEYKIVEEENSVIFKNPYVFLSGLRRATNALKDSQKPKWAANKIIESVNEGKNILIHSNFRDCGIKTIKDLLPSYIKYVSVTGGMSKKDRKISIEKYNSKEVLVMFITKAGGEGLDLKGTRNTIILEKGWNYANEYQAVGRSARYDSLKDEPEEERYVDIYYLMLIKPIKFGPYGNDSADVLLKNTMDMKEKIILSFLERLNKTGKCF
jgi:superfamily II DNA or RNA helicase